jgi:hypothetical protein
MTDLEHQMARLYNTAVIDIDVPVEEIVASAIRKGRRRRRVRRVVVATQWSCAGLLTAVLVGGAAYLFWPRDHAVSPPLQSATTRTPTPAVTKSVTPQAVARTLAALLTPYGTVSNIRATTSSTGASVGTLDLNNGHGPGAVSAVISGKPATAGTGQFGCPTGPGVTCSVRADGSVLITSQQTPATGGAAQWSVTVGQRDGTSVAVYEWNATHPKGPASAAGAVPPLTLSQLQAIATSDRW